MMDTADVIRRSIKLLDIGYSTAAYFLLALVAMHVMNWFSGPLDKPKHEAKSTPRLILDIFLRVWLIGVLSYVARNVFHLIPWPLEGVYGFRHLQVKEVLDSAVFTAFIVVFDEHLTTMVEELRRRQL
jgi:hypothetical protein